MIASEPYTPQPYPSHSVPPPCPIPPEWVHGEWILRVILIAYVILPLLLHSVENLLPMATTALPQSFVPWAIQLVWVGLLLFYLWQTPKAQRHDLLQNIGLHWSHGVQKLLLVTAALLVAMGLCLWGLNLLSWALSPLPTPANPHGVDTLPFEIPSFSSWPSLVLPFINGVLLAPVGEELAFRGFIQGYFAHRWPQWPWGAVLCSTLIFMVCHSQYETLPIALGYVFCMSLCLGQFRIKTQSLYPGILAHSANNLIAFLG